MERSDSLLSVDKMAENDFDDDDNDQFANGKDGKDGTVGRWTREEHQLFVQGLESFGKAWKKIANLIKTRTVVQIRTHAQKYFLKLAKSRQVAEECVGPQTEVKQDIVKRKKRRRYSFKNATISPSLLPFLNQCTGDQTTSTVDIKRALYNFLSPPLGEFSTSIDKNCQSRSLNNNINNTSFKSELISGISSSSFSAAVHENYESKDFGVRNNITKNSKYVSLLTSSSLRMNMSVNELDRCTSFKNDHHHFGISHSHSQSYHDHVSDINVVEDAFGGTADFRSNFGFRHMTNSDGVSTCTDPASERAMSEDYYEIKSISDYSEGLGMGAQSTIKVGGEVPKHSLSISSLDDICGSPESRVKFQKAMDVVEVPFWYAKGLRVQSLLHAAEKINWLKDVRIDGEADNPMALYADELNEMKRAKLRNMIKTTPSDNYGSSSSTSSSSSRGDLKAGEELSNHSKRSHQQLDSTTAAIDNISAAVYSNSNAKDTTASSTAPKPTRVSPSLLFARSTDSRLSSLLDSFETNSQISNYLIPSSVHSSLTLPGNISNIFHHLDSNHQQGYHDFDTNIPIRPSRGYNSSNSTSNITTSEDHAAAMMLDDKSFPCVVYNRDTIISTTTSTTVFGGDVLVSIRIFDPTAPSEPSLASLYTPADLDIHSSLGPTIPDFDFNEAVHVPVSSDLILNKYMTPHIHTQRHFNDMKETDRPNFNISNHNQYQISQSSFYSYCNFSAHLAEEATSSSLLGGDNNTGEFPFSPIRYCENQILDNNDLNNDSIFSEALNEDLLMQLAMIDTGIEFQDIKNSIRGDIRESGYLDINNVHPEGFHNIYTGSHISNAVVIPASSSMASFSYDGIVNADSSANGMDILGTAGTSFFSPFDLIIKGEHNNSNSSSKEEEESMNYF